MQTKRSKSRVVSNPLSLTKVEFGDLVREREQGGWWAKVKVGKPIRDSLWSG